MDNTDEKNTNKEIDPNQMMMVYAGPPGPQNPFIGMNGIGTVNIREGIYCFCPECGTMSKGEKFCRDCGTPLKDAKRYRDCSGCGTRLDADEKFCRECGKKQDTEETGLA